MDKLIELLKELNKVSRGYHKFVISVDEKGRYHVTVTLDTFLNLDADMDIAAEQIQKRIDIMKEVKANQEKFSNQLWAGLDNN